MKTIYTFLLLLLPVLALAACQPEHFREVYPAGDPQLTAELLTKEVQYAKDSISFAVTVTETETPLSTLSIKVVVGMNRYVQKIMNSVPHLPILCLFWPIWRKVRR